MLKLPDVSDAYRILAIDPGTDTLGICVIEIDLITFKPKLLEAATYRGSRALIHDVSFSEQLPGSDRLARNLYHMKNIESILKHYGIHYVAYETAFMGKFATAYEGLIECLTLIRMAVRSYDPFIPFIGVPTKNAKKSIEAKMPRKKPEVMEAIEKLIHSEKLICSDEVKLPFDEHTSDAIAVGWHAYITIIDSINKGNPR